MDILTPKGQETLAHEARAIYLWHSKYPSILYCETPKDSPAIVDAVLVRDNVVRGVVETKCRKDMSMDKFRLDYGFEWLVTNEKIQKGRYISEGLNVPFVGFLYLIDEDILLYQSIWVPEKGWVPDIKVRQTRTQRTVNGGTVMRENAFIDMSNAKIIRGSNNGQQSTSIGTV